MLLFSAPPKSSFKMPFAVRHSPLALSLQKFEKFNEVWFQPGNKTVKYLFAHFENVFQFLAT